jgi:hypothetical protein
VLAHLLRAPSGVKLSTIKVIAGLGLLMAIAFGNGASAAQHSSSIAPVRSEAGGTPIVAVAAIAVGVFGLQRRKG